MLQYVFLLFAIVFYCFLLFSIVFQYLYDPVIVSNNRYWHIDYIVRVCCIGTLFFLIQRNLGGIFNTLKIDQLNVLQFVQIRWDWMYVLWKKNPSNMEFWIMTDTEKCVICPCFYKVSLIFWSCVDGSYHAYTHNERKRIGDFTRYKLNDQEVQFQRLS